MRRLFCDNTKCDRRVFTERLPDLAAPWARKTTRLANQLTAVGLALGGAAGARLGRKIGLVASRNTLLRLVRQAPLPSAATPSALGVDDWAQRKRYTYGTVLVDLERRRPLALLLDREAGTLATWLRGHPGVEVVSRDRSGAYGSGARHGAPGGVEDGEASSAMPGPPAMQTSQSALRAMFAAERHARRLERHDAVWTMHRQGWRVEDIAARVGIGRTTVARHLRDQAPPPPRVRRRRSLAATLVASWHPVVADRWQAGQRNGRALHRELQHQGFAVSYPTLARHLQKLRRESGEKRMPRPRLQAGQRAGSKAHADRLTPRAAAWAVLRKQPDTAATAQLLQLDPAVAEAVGLSRDFAALVRERKPEALDAWLVRAQEGAATAFRRFAKRLLADYDAVRAAMTLDWSNGQVEGQINRLKTLKRQMYGPAGLDLLERRFLLAA